MTIDDRSYSVERTGPGYLVLREAADWPAGLVGKLRILIDDRVHEEEIVFPYGAVPFESDVEFVEKSPEESF